MMYRFKLNFKTKDELGLDSMAVPVYVRGIKSVKGLPKDFLYSNFFQGLRL